MQKIAINMEQVKKSNRSAILNFISENEPVSRKEIAAETGLTPAAVTILCTELLEEGLLVESGFSDVRRTAGRKEVLLMINSNYGNVISIDISPEFTTITIADISSKILKSSVINTNTNITPKEFLSYIALICKDLIGSLSGSERILGGCVGITGIVNKATGESTHAYGIWEEPVDVCGTLTSILGFPFIIENNVNAFAMAEVMYGAGKAYDNLLMIKWGPGVGSSIIINKGLYEGRHGKTAELGHFIVEKNGIQCSCGRKGCLETCISMHALCKALDLGSHVTAESLCHILTEDPKNNELFEKTIDIFARCIVNSYTILAPNRIVLFGSMFKTEKMRSSLIECCKSYVSSLDEGRILYSELAGMESYIGPLAVFVKERVLI